jgi:threonine/homoserine/homoserine lactone efflux protein
VGLNHLVLETLAYAGLAWLASRQSVTRRIEAAKPVFDRLTALVIGAFGIRLLIDR